MGGRQWKDLILRSGLPLEQSVLQKLREVEDEKFADSREYKYIRANEEGVPTVFSVDFNVTYYLHERALEVELFVECKYCHDGTRWVFIPEEYTWWLDEAFHEAFVCVDAFSQRTVSSRFIDERWEKYILCGKGVEFKSDKGNPQAIERAIYQLRYAVLEATIELVKHQADMKRAGIGNAISVLVPILVTTAELWRLRADVTVEDVRAAENLEDIADPFDSLIIKQEPDAIYTRAAIQRFEEEISEHQIDWVNQHWQGPYAGFRHFSRAFAQNYPSRYFVFNYASFSDNIRKLLSIFRDPNVLYWRSGGPENSSPSHPEHTSP